MIILCLFFIDISFSDPTILPYASKLLNIYLYLYCEIVLELCNITVICLKSSLFELG